MSQPASPDSPESCAVRPDPAPGGDALDDAAYSSPRGTRRHGNGDAAADGQGAARRPGHTPPRGATGQRRSGRRRGIRAPSLWGPSPSLPVRCGLTNLHDPDVITLAAPTPDLRAAAPEAFDRAYNRGLMNFRAKAHLRSLTASTARM